MGILSVYIFLPLVVGLLWQIVPSLRTYARPVSIVVAVAELVFSLIIYVLYSKSGVGYQLAEQLNWISLPVAGSEFLIMYSVGVDGLSLPLILMSSLVMSVAVLSSASIAKHESAYYTLLMLLYTSINGCFLAIDSFLFFVFFEFILLPMYFLIGIWGGERREYAAVKFIIYTLGGSILVLIVLITLSMSFTNVAGQHTFSLLDFTNPAMLGSSSLLADPEWRFWAFATLMAGFLIKLPAVPLHTWLPDAHVEAPTPVSVILAGILLKIGAYGMLRIAVPVFPEQVIANTDTIAWIGVLSIVYAGYCALAQKDLKKMIAYSSVAHMGFVVLAIAANNAQSLNGAIFQLVSHGFISSMLFVLAGVLYDRTHNRMIEDYRGLYGKMPYFTVFVIIAFFASFGLPGFSGFIAEFFILLGTFSAVAEGNIALIVALSALLGLLLSAAYYLWTLQRMFYGKFAVRKPEWEVLLTDINKREFAVLVLLSALILLLGVYPNIVFGITNFWVK